MIDANSRTCFGAIAVMAALVTLALALALAFAPAAHANSAEGYERALGKGSGEGAGQLDLAAPVVAGPSREHSTGEVLLAGSGVAVNDETHDVYVADTGNRRVDEFGPGGEFIRAFGAQVEPLGGNVCMEITGCRKGALGAAPGELAGELAQPRFVAVDNAPGAAHGDVYVGDGVGREEANETQYLEFGTAQEGTYTLTVDGETTEPIPYKRDSEEVIVKNEPRLKDVAVAEAALERLPAIGEGNVTAEDEAEGRNGGAVVGLKLEFVGALAATAVPLLSCDAAGLSPSGQSCPVSVSVPAARFAVEGITKFSEDGVLEEGWGQEGRLTGSSGVVQVASGTGELTAGSESVPLSTSTGDWNYGLEQHQPIEVMGEGIPAGTFVTFVQGHNGVLELSQPANKTGSFALSMDGRYQLGGQFDGITVNSAGDVLALAGNQEQLYEFEPSGAFGPDAEPVQQHVGAVTPAGIAVNAAGDLFTVGSGAAQETSPSGQGLGTVSGAHKPFPTGLALDTAPGGALYLGLGDAVEDASSAETFGAPELKGSAGVAVDSSTGDLPLSGAVYVANTVADQVDVNTLLLEAETRPAAEETASSMTLNGVVNPEAAEISECTFEYGTVAGEYTHTVECAQSPAQIGSTPGEVPVTAQISGLRGSTVYHFRLVARKGAVSVPGADLSAATLPVPLLSGEEAVEVTGSSARLQAFVNPDGVQVKHCEFEYGTSATYGNLVSCEQSKAQIGAGSEPVLVSATLTGLEPNTTYHWRLSVTDANGEGYGPDHTFVYQTSGSVLPDHRAYEMVTPPFKDGALVGDTYGYNLIYDVAEDGASVIALSNQCFAGAQSCVPVRKYSQGEPFEFTRTPTGWVTTALAPPATVFSTNSAWTFGAETGTALFSMPTGAEGQEEWYARSADGSFADIGPMVYSGPHGLDDVGGHTYAGTADLSHLVWEVNGFAAEQWPYDKTAGAVVYEDVGTGDREPLLVGVTGGQGSTELISDCGTSLGGHGQRDGVTDYLSADGRTVFFTAYPCASGGSGANSGVAVAAFELYARVDGELSDAHTVAVSRPQCEDAECRESEAHPGEAFFEGAAEDGSRVFFLDPQQLTDGAVQGTGEGRDCPSGECNLYMYDLDAPEGSGLVDVSESHVALKPGEVAEDPRVQGVMAVSPDGSHVYFVAKGALTEAPNKLGQSARAGQDNLYVYERDEAYPAGHLAFITILPRSQEVEPLDSHAANVTPDGQFLVFESGGALTPDDTRTDGATQVFRYDAQTEELARVSIGNDGFDDDGNAGIGNAAIVTPQTNDGPPLGGVRDDPTMSNDGARVFFESPVGLTAHALDDVLIASREGRSYYAENVYEWEQPGVGSCPASQEAGCVYLISDGRDVSTAHTPRCETGGTETERSSVCLLGTDATGANVFFTTADQLVSSDTDTQLDIYDARICEPENGNPCITEPPAPLPPCQGEACHGIPEATPSQLAPGSASFNGEGNIAPAAAHPSAGKGKALTKAQKLADALKVCKRDKRKKKRTKCAKRARKKYGAVKARKSAKGKK